MNRSTKPNLTLPAIAAAAASLLAGTAQAATCPAALAPATLCTLITFEKVGSLDPFGGMDATVEANPTNALQKSAKFVKDSTDETWAGATVWTYNDPVGAPKAVNPTFGFSQGTKIQMAVYAQKAGIPIMVKVQDALNSFLNKESGSVMTTKAGWQTLVFDFAGVDTTKTYNQLIVFPGFQASPPPGTPSTVYIDNIVYPTGVKKVPVSCNTGGPIVLVGGKYASDYSATGTIECGSYGYYSGDSSDQLWWFGYGDSTTAGEHPAMYFGYGIKIGSPSWGIGGYVKAPKNGYVQIGATKNNVSGVTFELWGNTELTSLRKPLNVVLKARRNATLGCQASISTTVTPPWDGVASYSTALSAFKLDLPACGVLNTAAKVLASGIAEFHAQALAPNLFTGDSWGTGYSANALNIGKITFTP
jgi:hypothetical protein